MLTTLLVIYSLLTSMLLVQHERRLDENKSIITTVGESVVSLEAAGGRGTGFLVRAKSGKKVIVTNAHVCELVKTSSLFVVYHRDGKSVRKKLNFPTVVIKEDSKHDLCMAMVPPDLDAEPLELADSVSVDEKVYILGYPIEVFLSSSEGYVRGSTIVDTPWLDSAPIDKCVGEKHYIKTVPIQQENGEIALKDMCFLRAVFLFTDALGYHGASGGPALNSDGEVVGVMSMITGEARPFALLVPLKNLREFLSTY